MNPILTLLISIAVVIACVLIGCAIALLVTAIHDLIEDLTLKK